MTYTRIALMVSALFLFLNQVGCTRATRSVRGGHDIGPHRLSVYWIAHERWFKGTKRTPLYSHGKRLAWVSKSFAKAVRMQGSGVLRNGWLVQYKSKCKRSRMYCLNVRVLSRKAFPSSVGAAGRPLRPLRSLAVDTRQIRFGTRLYIPVLGRMITRRGRRHNGCFVAHDRGGRIRGARLDLFAGHRGIYRRYLHGRLPRHVQVYINHPRCASRTALR